MISTWSNSMVNINVNENKGKCLEVRFWEECVCVCEKEIEGERERERVTKNLQKLILFNTVTHQNSITHVRHRNPLPNSELAGKKVHTKNNQINLHR